MSRISALRNYVQHISRHTWLLLLINVLLYLNALPLGLVFSFAWWFFASQRVSTKLKRVVLLSVGGVLGLLILLTAIGVYAYVQDPEPTLEVTSPQNDQVVQSESIEVRGNFTPSNFQVTVNDRRIESQDGTFVHQFPLEVGANTIEVVVSNSRSLKKTFSITREQSMEEKASQSEQHDASVISPNPSPQPTTTPSTTPPQIASQDTVLVTRIIDGDTFEIEGGQRVRLIGVDTPEVGECYYTEAKDRLSALIFQQKIRLIKDISETDRYGRLLRYVYIGDTFVNDVLVREGFAYATSYPPDVKHQGTFRSLQSQAQTQAAGFWSMCSTPSPTPSSKSVKSPTQSNPQTQSAPATVNPGTQPTGACAIKGNISSSGEKIFHAPGQRDYAKTIIDESKGERFFCTEDEARAAGWRKAMR